MNKKHLVICILLATSYLFSATLNAKALLSQASKLFREGDVKGAGDKCADIMFSEGIGDEDKQKALVLQAISLLLQDGKDSKKRCEDLLVIAADDDTFRNSPAITSLKFINGKIDAAKLMIELKKSTPDWQAVGRLCQYLMRVKNQSPIHKLYESMEQYRNLAKVIPPNNWAATWNNRIVKWQKWLQSSSGNSAGLENLIVKNKPAPEKNISDILSLLLDKKVAEAQKKISEMKESFKGKDKNNPSLIVLNYLSGSSDISGDQLFEATKRNSDLWGLTTLGIFIRKVATQSKDKYNQMAMKNDLRNYLVNFDKFRSPDVKKWKPRAQLWMTWCDKKFTNIPGLEPLFKSATSGASGKDTSALMLSKGENTTAFDIKKMSYTDLKKIREPYRKRPKPKGLVFNRDKVRDYIKSLKDKEQQKAELIRYNKIKGMRDHLVHLFARNSYKGPIKMGYRTVFGTLYLANDRIFRVKRGRSKRGKSYKWEDLAFSQWVKFFEHFANIRLKMHVPNTPREEIKKHAAEDFLRISVLCDWYGSYRNSVKFAKKAIQINPELQNQTNQMFFNDVKADQLPK